MNKFINLLSTKRFGTMLAISMIAVFLILSLVRIYPFKSLESVVSDVGNDWATYVRFALAIKHDGIFTPLLTIPPGEPYYSPSGFLYNYFIALCLMIFGEKSLPIFVIQHLMLGLSAALIYWTFRDKMKSSTGFLFLCALFAFAFMDVYKNYSCRMLSENLMIFTIASFFFCFVKGFEKDNFRLQLMSAVLLGLSFLVRPNLFLFEILIIPIVALSYLKKGKGALIKLFTFTIVLFLSSSFLLIRNYVVCKKPVFLTAMMSFNYVINANDVPLKEMTQRPVAFFGYYTNKIIFCLGFLPILNPRYRLRPHWMIMWIGYFTYIFLRIRDRAKLEMWEAVVHLYIICYYVPIILSTPVHNYGFRMLIPVTSFVLLFSFMALDKLRPGKN